MSWEMRTNLATERVDFLEVGECEIVGSGINLDAGFFAFDEVESCIC